MRIYIYLLFTIQRKTIICRNDHVIITSYFCNVLATVCLYNAFLDRYWSPRAKNQLLASISGITINRYTRSNWSLDARSSVNSLRPVPPTTLYRARVNVVRAKIVLNNTAVTEIVIVSCIRKVIGRQWSDREKVFMERYKLWLCSARNAGSKPA